MKKFLILSVMILISFMAFGQTEETTTFQTTEQSVSQLTPDSASLVTRDANKYIANGEIMNKRAFMGFLKSRDAIAYKQFRTGYNLSLAGWVLLACGGVTMTVGLCGILPNLALGMFVLPIQKAKGDEDDHIEHKIETFSWIFTAGMVTSIASAICLGTGYGIMHNTPNIYNGNITKRKPVVTFNLQSSRDGLGIAMRF
ncbi:MAG: hypothetical protein MJ002_07090 [Paludibacteraceae bacterium]|nr:hypothetical protein [Paludibacteraceae bacterium]